MASLVSSASTSLSGSSAGTGGSLPPRDPATWSLQDATHAVWASYPRGFDRTLAEAVEAYVQGDHLQKGQAWIGSGFDDSGALSSTALSDITRMLTPVPEAFACVERRVEGACGVQADITVRPLKPGGEPDQKGERQPTDEQASFAVELKSDLAYWIDTSGAWGGKDLRKPTGVRGMVASATCSQSGSACLRLFYNPAARTLDVAVKNGDGEVVGNEKRIPPKDDRRAGFKEVRIVAPPPDRCAVYADPDTHQKTGVFLFTENQQECAEIWYERDGKTFLRMLRGGDAGAPEEWPLGGMLPIQQAEIGCLFTDAVRRLQGVCDFSGTALTRNTQSMGWGQRTESNTEDDGFWSTSAPAGVENPRTRVTDGVTEYFNPIPAPFGPTIVRRLVGIEHTTGANADGIPTTGLTTPAVHYHEPSPSASIIEALDADVMLVREAFHQGHIRTGLRSSTAEASGDAYEQARAAFQTDINGVGEVVDGVWAPILTVATMMALWIARDDNPAETLSDWLIGSQCHPSAGAPSVESQREVRENVAAELLSPEEGTARLNIQDVPAERTRIAASRSLSMTERRLKAAADAAGAGLNVRKVLIATGLTEGEADEWVQSDGLPNISQ